MKILLYDKTFDGFLTAVYDAFYLKGEAAQIMPMPDETLLIESIIVQTDTKKAKKVATAIKSKLGGETLHVIRYAWRSHGENIENCLLEFLRQSFKMKRNICNMLQNDIVKTVTSVSKRVEKETFRMLEFIRFKKVGNVFISDIEPDNDILDLIAGHFIDRFGSEQFIIRDLRYNKALIHGKRSWKIVDIENAVSIDGLIEDTDFEIMWKKYYDTLCIKERKNLKLMQQHVPKKYWQHITEKR